MAIKTVIGYLSTLIALLPIFIGLTRKKDEIWYYAALSLVSDILIRVFRLNEMVAEKNITANIYFFLNVFLIVSYFRKHFKDRFTWLHYISGVVFLAALVHFFFNGFYIFDGVSAAILCIIYLMYSVAALYSMLDSPEVISLWRSPFFINTLGILLFYSVLFMLFALANYFQQIEGGKQTLAKLWILNDIANIVQFLLFSRAMLLEKQTIQPQPQPQNFFSR